MLEEVRRWKVNKCCNCGSQRQLMMAKDDNSLWCVKCVMMPAFRNRGKANEKSDKPVSDMLPDQEGDPEC